MLLWPEILFHVVLGALSCTDCGVVDCSPWKVRVSAAETHLCRDMNANYAIGQNGQAIILPVDTVLRVLDANGAGWYRVTDDADPPTFEGYVRPARTTYHSGTPTGDPFVEAGDGGRDGGVDSAIAYAETYLPDGARYTAGTYAGYIGSEPPQPDLTTGFSNRCLGFVSTCYGVTRVSGRCPEMYLPNTYGYPNTAWGAYMALNDGNKILTSPMPPPRGAIVFWGKSSYNGNNGHIALTSDDSGSVISSGAPGANRAAREGEDGTNYQYHETGSHPDVWRTTIDEVTGWTDAAFLGYTTPETGFMAPLWGGKACLEPEEPETS